MVSFPFPLSAAAALAVLLPLVTSQPGPAASILPRVSPPYNHEFSQPLPIPPTKQKLTTYTDYNSGIEIDFYEVKIQQFTKNLFPGLGDATLIGYDGMAPGPTFRVKKGRETVVSRAPFDGWAADTIAPGQYKDYYYPNKQSARTLWYHDHAQGLTAMNAYAGQAGFYIIEDDDLEEKLDLPRGDYDIPLMVQSRFYTAEGNISDISTQFISVYGDTYSVNGQILPYLEVEPRKYRFRIVNAAASRTFNFTLTDNSTATPQLVPMYVVGSDAGFMSKPVETLSLVTGMAERWEVVIDFASYSGKNLTLASWTNSTVFIDHTFVGTGNVMQFRVGSNYVTSEAGNGDLPAALVSLNLPTNHDTIDQMFLFGRIGNAWVINGRRFADPANRILRNVPRGVTEKWLLRGSNGWSHPVHIHLVDFQILSRTNRATSTTGRNYVSPYEAAALKDVATVGTGENVTVLAKYAPFDGVYMFHCHNLVHEDHDMMAAFNVTSLPDFGYPEKTRFLDPMQKEFRAKEYTGSDLNTIEDEILPAFAKLKAYKNVHRIEAALDRYHATRASKLVGESITSTSVAGLVSSTSVALATTTAK
ncbi:Cupredoxin [Geopyxis carbonaria]|nr:Cupredoxin [Geopyxis carbonaria]